MDADEGIAPSFGPVYGESPSVLLLSLLGEASCFWLPLVWKAKPLSFLRGESLWLRREAAFNSRILSPAHTPLLGGEQKQALAVERSPDEFCRRAFQEVGDALLELGA